MITTGRQQILNSSLTRELRIEVLLKGREIGFGDVDDLLADIDTVVAVHLANLVKADDEGTVHSHELLWRQHVLNGFHREMGDEGAPFTFEIKHHVVLHAADVDDVADGDLAIFAVDFEEEGGIVVYS